MAKSSGSKRPAGRGKTPAKGRRYTINPDDSFPVAFAALLRERKIRVPAGLADAPREAYASQPATFVEQLAGLPDPELKTYAEKIAGYAGRQAKRAKAAWDASPLIKELRRRKLREPACPVRVVGASVSLRKQLSDWSNDEIVHAAQEWSRMGQA
jgi:hypothetical protein